MGTVLDTMGGGYYVIILGGGYGTIQLGVVMVVICVVLSMVRFSCWSIMVVVIMLVHHGGRIVRGFMLMRDGGCHRDGRYVVSGILMVIPISSFIPISSCLVSS